MAFKRQNDTLATFSMASMTDVIFLLLVFFMVTSTFVFPTAMEINLPEGAEQASIKPATRVYIDSLGNISAAYADSDPMSLDTQGLLNYLKVSLAQDTTQTSVAIYADEAVKYGRIVEVLNIGATNDIKMVLATRPPANRVQAQEADAEGKESAETGILNFINSKPGDMQNTATATANTNQTK